jgi:hypothetical protein
MENKFSTVINEQNGTYVVVLNCWTINEEGQRVTVDSKTLSNIADYPSALVAATEFYNKNKD